jgi:hypothetical protein
LDKRWLSPNSPKTGGADLPIFPFGEATVGVARRTPFVTSELGGTWGEPEDVIRVRSGAKTALGELQGLKIRCLGPPANPPPKMFPISNAVEN